MFIESLSKQHLFTAVGFIVGGLLVGIILEKIILVKLKKFAARTSWEGDELIIAAIRGVAILWCAIAGIYGALYNLPIEPKIAAIIEKILLVLLIISATIVIAKITVGLIALHSKKTANLPSASLFINMTRILIFSIGILIILQSIGISITPLITALGIGGLAVALALQPTLSNLFAGLQIIISKQVEVGDYVQLDSGEKGYVTDISWRNTKIREIWNNLIVVPNSKLADAIVTNFHLPQKEMSVIVECGVSYDSDLEKVEKITIDVAKKVLDEIQGGQSEFEPFIRFHTFGDSSINFNIILRVKEFVNQYLVTHEFIKALHKRYGKEGITIPFPIRTLYMKKEVTN
jgi:small-conductance mechanosensitive channel